MISNSFRQILFLAVLLNVIMCIKPLTGQSLDSLSNSWNHNSLLLSELGIGYASTLSGRKGDLVLQYNIGYKPTLSEQIKLNAILFIEGINTGRVLLNFGPKIGMQFQEKNNWKLAFRLGVGLLNNQDQKPGTLSYEFNAGLEDELAFFCKYNSYATNGFANGDYLSFGLQLEGIRSLKTTAIAGGTVGAIALILSAIISRSR